MPWVEGEEKRFILESILLCEGCVSEVSSRKSNVNAYALVVRRAKVFCMLGLSLNNETSATMSELVVCRDRFPWDS